MDKKNTPAPVSTVSTLMRDLDLELRAESVVDSRIEILPEMILGQQSAGKV